MEAQHDTEFGTLTESIGGWALEARVELGGQPVAIEIESSDGGAEFEEQQRQAARLALALGPDALDDAAPAVVQNYEVYREAISDELPPLGSPSEVWQQVRIERIRVPRHYEAQHAYFLIDAECDWDEEHGLEVRFRDGAAIEASQQGDTGGAHDDAPEHLAMIRQLISDANSQFGA